jgi:hypothetical protein
MDDFHNNYECVEGGGGDKFHTPQHAVNFKHNTLIFNAILQNNPPKYEYSENT